MLSPMKQSILTLLLLLVTLALHAAGPVKTDCLSTSATHPPREPSAWQLAAGQPPSSSLPLTGKASSALPVT